MPLGLNALMDPSQIGAGFQNAFQLGMQNRRQMETQRAMGEYAKNQNADTARAVAVHDPQLGMRVMDREEDRAAQVAKAAQEQTLKFVKLAQFVESHPNKEAAYQQGLRIAAQAGLDVSQAPPNYDPAWMQDKLAFSQAFLAEPEKMTALMQEVAAMGYQPGTPEFQAEMRRQRDPTKIVPLQPGGTIAGYTPGEGLRMLVLPNDGSAAPGSPAGSAPKISSPEQLAQLPPGTVYIAPDGSTRRKGGAVSNGSGNFPPQQ